MVKQSPQQKKRKAEEATDPPNDAPREVVSAQPVRPADCDADPGGKLEAEDVHMLIVGDMHFCERNFTQTEMVADLVLRFVAKYAMNIDEVLLLGDLIDRLQWMNVARAQRWLEALSVHKRVRLVIGNHDRPAPHSLNTDHPFHGMNSMIKVMDSTCRVNINGFSFGYIPYVPPRLLGEQIEVLLNPDEPVLDCVFGHNTYGQPYGQEWPARAPLMITGHEHAYKWVQENVLQPGPPYQVKRDEPFDTGIMLARFRKDHGVTVTPFQESLRAEVEAHGLFSYQRINLRIPCKKTYFKSCEELREYEVEDASKVIFTSILVTGTAAEIASLKATVRYRELARHPRISINCQRSPGESALVARAEPCKPFADVLEQKITDRRMLGLFEKLFKSMQVDP